MFKLSNIAGALIAVSVLTPSAGYAAEPVKAQTQARQQSEEVYGGQLMTAQERDEYRAKMRSLKTQEERDAFRVEHHKSMQERATAKGVTLPAMPMAGAGMGAGKPAGGMGPGAGMGAGMGPGAGQGGGRGR